MKASFTYISFFYLCQIPYLLVQCVPLASLFASSSVMYRLSVSNEMTAMLTFGYSPKRLLGPLVFCGFIVTGGTFSLSEFLVPISSKQARYITKVVFEGKKHSFLNKTNWSRSDRTFYSYDSYKPEKKVFNGLKIINLDENFRLLEVKRIKGAVYREKSSSWVFNQVEVLSFTEADDFFVTKEFIKREKGHLPVSPDLLKIERRSIQELALSDLSSIIKRNKESGMSLLEVYIAFHTKLSHLGVSFLFCFAGFPLAFLASRRRETLKSFFSIIFLGFGYWLLFSFLRAVLLTGVLDVGVGVWASNMILFSYLFYQIRKVLKEN